jgi:hypothetical protein
MVIIGFSPRINIPRGRGGRTGMFGFSPAVSIFFGTAVSIFSIFVLVLGFVVPFFAIGASVGGDNERHERRAGSDE